MIVLTGISRLRVEDVQAPVKEAGSGWGINTRCGSVDLLTSAKWRRGAAVMCGVVGLGSTHRWQPTLAPVFADQAIQSRYPSARRVDLCVAHAIVMESTKGQSELRRSEHGLCVGLSGPRLGMCPAQLLMNTRNGLRHMFWCCLR